MSKKVELSEMKGVAERDRKLIVDAEKMMGPEPEEMGFVKNLFWGNGCAKSWSSRTRRRRLRRPLVRPAFGGRSTST